MNLIQKIRNLENNKFLNISILFYIFIWWLLPFVLKGEVVVLEYVGQISVALIATLALLCFEDTFIPLMILVLFPFMLPDMVTFYTIPIGLISSIVLFVLGIVCHILIYKPKISKMKFSTGLLLLGITMGLGGLGIEYEFKLIKMLLLFVIGCSILFGYGFFTSTTKKQFGDLVQIINYLGLLIVLQVFVFIMLHTDTFLVNKGIKLGWAANSNTLAMILLCCIPFAIYSALKNEKLKAIAFYVLSFLEILVLIFSYSRGAILAGFVAFSGLIITLLCLKEYRKKTLYFLAGSLAAIVVIIVLISIIKVDILKYIYTNLTKINLDSMNGRTPIYEKMLGEIVKKPVFGYGLLYGFSEPNKYLWGHNTFLHTTYSLGIIGLIAILWHHVEKYLYCIKKFSFEKLIVLISFLAADAYGFIDVNYFLPNFMIILILSLIMLDTLYRKEETQLDIT